MKTTSLLAALLVFPCIAGTQAAPPPPPPPPPPTAPAASAAPTCLQSIPPASLTRVVVSAALTMADSGRLAVPATAANMLQAVVDHLQVSLGAKPGVLPQGEPGIPWDSAGRALLVTWHRDGKLGWRVEDEPDPLRPAGAQAALLLGRVLDEAQAAGEAFMAWPDNFKEDSVEMRIGFVSPDIDEKGKVHPLKAKVAVPMFSVAAPRVKLVRVRKWPPQHYPLRLQELGVEGKVTMRFVVDTTGHADILTIRDASPVHSWETTAAFSDYHREFVSTAREMIMQARYTPAEAGGCKIRQVVQQPFTWAIR